MIYQKDRDLKLMRAGVSQGFTKQFEEGYQAYSKGKWKIAIECLQKALVLRPRDGPSVSLLNFMESNNNTPPADWEGFHALTEK